MNHKPMRLQKYISACGKASRRHAEELISAGEVTVNGRAAEIGMSVVPGKDHVLLSGELLELPRGKTYIALNKPRGYVTTMSDELGRRCITELIKEVGPRVFPIGRLDRDSEGLLLLTDDGLFANALMHPKNHVAKVYHVSVRPPISEEQLTRISTGVEIDGAKVSPAKIVMLHRYEDRSVLEFTLFEGKNREIRRICEALNLEVARLSRVEEGAVRLGGMKPGEWRELTEKELASLRRMAGIGPKPNAPK